MFGTKFARSAVLAASLASAATIITPLSASAETGSSARETGFGSSIRVTAGIASPANCARITGKRNGAPGGRAVHRDAKPVTIIVAMSGGQCGKRSLHYTFQTSAGGKSLIQLFFVSTSGKLLKNEKISIATAY
ncbi:MAG: hypothetical protein KDJ55_11560 [Rhodobiaceae bacterium]|nr:hypothetical protein [Rhodobiaceae bacterium]MCC0013417.1 hypothetical protein [Rhodobiaceae bacterium]MCC0018228.1 hypothetical protein [Rhodobiaceae bacterium]MCC0050825.1 hypothetical protein [Rhodobiaceae bacterium]MCC0060530.1 hypothetical protein [Rhodobiaceae bacterium]